MLTHAIRRILLKEFYFSKKTIEGVLRKRFLN